MGFSNERMRTGQLVNWFLLDGLELTPAGSHGMGGGGAAAVAPAVQVAPQAAPVVQAVAPPAPPKPKPKQTREQQLLAQVKGNPAALM